MIKRKLLMTLVASPLSMFVIVAAFFDVWQWPLGMLMLTGIGVLMASPYILLYGVPVSFFSDFISKRFIGRVRMLIAFLVHILFAFLFGLIGVLNNNIPLLGLEVDAGIVFAVIVAFFFWLVDELLRIKLKNIRRD
ncbi:hypothetical protein F9U64_06370 [Gracilibacillus oryzae]|uniref:Uncharacterized protein n=1 Tax=Gracilibacillus oryzae TaxID=1672701 RepID=A0A7C8L4T7_9BACI|nr:hypothetical protein [Gracilibacillus oryzae]KAB8138068.1 hypothetical protein F9U64_06370 [Gracilibacillus oryzae]